MIDQSEIAQARRALGRQLAQYRSAAGYNQHRLAPHTLYGRSTIANVEIGRQNVPRDFWQRCDEVLGTDGALTSAYDELQALIQRQRREAAQLEARPVAVDGAGRWTMAGREQRVVSIIDVEAVRELTQAFRNSDNKFGGGHTHTIAAQYLDLNVATMLREGFYTEAVGRELCAVAAQLAHLVAWSAYDIQEHERAQLYFAKATKLATSAGDRAFCGEILAARSHHAIHLGHPIEAVALVRGAQDIARKAAVPLLLAESFELEANGLALLGNPKEALSSLRRSEIAFQRSDAADTPDWLRYFDETYIAIRFAHCFRDLGLWDHARTYALQAVGMSNQLARTHVFNTALLATAYVETDLDQACRVGLDAVRLAENFQSARVLNYIRDVRRRLLKRRGDDPHVRQFTDSTAESLGDN